MWWLLLACVSHKSGSPAADSSVAAHTESSPTGSGSDSSRAPDSGSADSGSADSGSGDSGSGDSGSGDSRSADSGSDDSGSTLPADCSSFSAAVAMGIIEDPALDELSGLVVSRASPGVLWTHEDSGGNAELIAIDTRGVTLATVPLVDADGVAISNTDWEDLALFACPEGWCLRVGDIGDLGTDRSEFSLLTLPEPPLDSLPAVARVAPFTYPSEPEDAEALVVDGDGTSWIFTKRDDATSGVYRLVDGDSVVEPVGEIVTGASGESLTAMVTAADLWQEEGRLLLRTYLHLYELDARDLTSLGPPEPLSFAFEFQGEAIAWDPDNRGFWQVSEGVNPILWFTACAD